MDALPIDGPISREDYLAADLAIDERLEFADGVITAKPGSGYAHSSINGNLLAALSSRLRGKGCQALGSGLRVKSSGGYFYPDGLVLRGGPQFEEGVFDTLTNPTVIFEILSPSTEARDRGEKFAHYRTIPTMREYVLLSQSAAVVETYRRMANGGSSRLSKGSIQA